jgi:hypothetical protein
MTCPDSKQAKACLKKTILAADSSPRGQLGFTWIFSACICIFVCVRKYGTDHEGQPNALMQAVTTVVAKSFDVSIHNTTNARIQNDVCVVILKISLINLWSRTTTNRACSH